MELGNRMCAAAPRSRPLPFPGGWPEQLVVVAMTGKLWPLFLLCNVCRASISVHDTFLIDFEIICRASISAHGKAFPCVTMKSARQSAFTVQLSIVRPLLSVFEKNARQSLCRALYCLCRAPQTHGNPSNSHSDTHKKGVSYN
jgi:hypothetical protein